MVYWSYFRLIKAARGGTEGRAKRLEVAQKEVELAEGLSECLREHWLLKEGAGLIPAGGPS